MKLLVVDNGLYVEFARRLAISGIFERVGYFAPWQTDFATVREQAVGTGFSEFERVYDLYGALEDYDAFAFPDLYWSDLQAQLRDAELPVWGAGSDDELELNRQLLLEQMNRVGLETPHYTVVRGIDAALTAAEPGDFIKVSGYMRGDMETIVHKRGAVWPHELALRIGPAADTVPIIVAKPLPPAVEVGFDALVAHGTILLPMLVGYEKKDAAYLGKVVNELPPSLAAVAAGVQEMISLDYNQFLSTECIGGTLIDLTCRVPQPPGDAHFHLWRNLAAVVADAMRGRLLSPQPVDDYVCQLVIRSNALDRFARLRVPRRLEGHVVLHRAFRIKDVLWTAPQRDEKLPEVGAVVSTGGSVRDAIDSAREIVEELDLPPELSVDIDSANGLLKTITEGESEGVPF